MAPEQGKLPSRAALQKAWEEVQRVHREHLAVHQVRLPSAKHYSEAAKALWLAVLYHFKGQGVDKNYISEITKRDMPHLSADQQVRHLKRDGWDLGSAQGVHQLNPYQPSAEFINSAQRKNRRLEADSFSDLIEAFGHRCATCGARQGEPDPRYGKTVVKLQQGHQDPLGAGDDMKNIIPQCQFCNRAYKNDFVFDAKGRVVSVCSLAPVKKARAEVQASIYEWLKKKYDRSG